MPSKHTSAPPLVIHPQNASQGHALGLKSIAFKVSTMFSRLLTGANLARLLPLSSLKGPFPALISYSGGVQLTQSSRI